MMPSRLIFDIRLGQKIADDEVLVARALGYEWQQAYQSSCDAFDDFLDISHQPEKPLIPVGLKMIGWKSNA